MTSRMGTCRRLAVGFGAVAMVGLFCAPRAETQDPKLKPTFGTVTLEAGFDPDPYAKKVEAGGQIKANHQGVTGWIANAPDVRLNYTAGEYQLTIRVEADTDTVLFVNLPNGKWVANDDAPGGGTNPLLRFNPPMSGQYDIWVGTYKQGNAPAKLIITEKK